MCAKIPGSSVRDFYHNLDNNQGKEVILKAENNKILKEKKNWILLLFKKLAKLIFNRIFYVAVAMLVQLGWILMMVLRLAAYSRYIDIGLRLIGIVLVLWILNLRRALSKVSFSFTITFDIDSHLTSLQL